MALAGSSKPGMFQYRRQTKFPVGGWARGQQPHSIKLQVMEIMMNAVILGPVVDLITDGITTSDITSGITKASSRNSEEQQTLYLDPKLRST